MQTKLEEYIYKNMAPTTDAPMCKGHNWFLYVQGPLGKMMTDPPPPPIPARPQKSTSGCFFPTVSAQPHLPWKPCCAASVQSQLNFPN